MYNFYFFLVFKQNTIEGKIAYFPAPGRLLCESTNVDHQGFWAMDGFGLLAVYKSDWIRFGGKYIEQYSELSLSREASRPAVAVCLTEVSVL